MRTLILMRHAKSDWSDESLSDHERPLNARGRRATPLVANWLQENGLFADFILASSAVRAQETLQGLQESWCTNTESLTEAGLYLATPKEISRHVDALHDSWSTVLLVGHNPGFSALASALHGLGVEMPTAAVAVFRSNAENWKHSIAQASWTMSDFVRPRELE